MMQVEIPSNRHAFRMEPRMVELERNDGIAFDFRPAQTQRDWERFNGLSEANGSLWVDAEAASYSAQVGEVSSTKASPNRARNRMWQYLLVPTMGHAFDRNLTCKRKGCRVTYQAHRIFAVPCGCQRG
jgi:hypothetical protein